MVHRLALAALIAISINFAAGCSSDSSTLDWFKTTTGSGLSSVIGGADVEKCVGVSGKVQWKIFRSEGQSSELRTVQADLTNKGRTAVFQWVVNPERRNFELSYAAVEGKPLSPLLLGITLLTLCSL